MPYYNLTDFVQVLEREGELKRITYPVKAELEITEIADRVMKSGGPALLFENVVGKQIPVLINAFGSAQRMALALGVADIEEIARNIQKLIQTKPPKSFKDKLNLLGELIRLAGIPPKTRQRRRVPRVCSSRAGSRYFARADLLARRRWAVHHAADGVLERSALRDAQRWSLSHADLRSAQHGDALALT